MDQNNAIVIMYTEQRKSSIDYNPDFSSSQRGDFWKVALAVRILALFIHLREEINSLSIMNAHSPICWSRYLLPTLQGKKDIGP